MKAFLMHRDEDFDLERVLPWNAQTLIQDLELNTLFRAMALGDTQLFEVAKSAVLCALQNNLNTILFRQDVLKDCLNNPSPVREIYAVARGAIESEKKDYWGLLSRYPSSILHRSIDVMRMFVTNLKQLKHIADAHGDKFTSEGFRAFFIMLKTELTDEYFATVENHLAELQFRRGVLISGELGKGNKGANYVLRKARARQQKWLARLLEKKPQEYTFSLHPRDDNGPRALEELRGRGINLVANVLAQSTEHILGFFNMLQTELAFYIGCLNLYEQLSQRGEPVCFPLPVATGERRLSFHALYDVCLALSLKEKVVGNDVNADGKNLMIITGANRGGKSTFLRSIGLAQLMMQAGMFVPAESFCSELCSGLFTHYKREEDITMKSGKFAEELGRMSDIVDHITSHSMLLFNESFSATNEREGSEVARQIILALLESHVKIVFVTHLYEFAHSLSAKKMSDAIFLRAERHAGGVRTFKLVEGEPLQTSFGEDLYQRIFVSSEAVPGP